MPLLRGLDIASVGAFYVSYQMGDLAHQQWLTDVLTATNVL